MNVEGGHYMSDLGKLLEHLRKAQRLSLREVSERCGISHTYIRDLELSKNRSTNKPIKPSPEILEKLADAYNFSYENLMQMAGYLKEEEPESTIDYIIPHTNSIIYFRLLNDRLELTFVNEIMISMKVTISEITKFMESLDRDVFKKVDVDVYVNFNHIKSYDEENGILYYGEGQGIEISKTRQNKLHRYIVTKVAKNNNKQAEFSIGKTTKKQGLLGFLKGEG
jgi:transcriptional regulator with XRE-family HTH domain